MGVKPVELNINRRRFGESHPRAVLDRAGVDKVFALREQGLSFRAIARALGCSPGGAHSIYHGRTRATYPAR